ncbi:hypothetical protein KIN20_001443 [Parelaphostrongylus tenuis]|uniref:Uncharacterized protein n=1 Tax=Parelaphostrongylus tenuis TaxID=148309 RepID=A0AAD5MEY7_PARTN|nr:hypothetical protein KIN20_001443 [Parelaphostrongylus tenuis]
MLVSYGLARGQDGLRQSGAGKAEFTVFGVLFVLSSGSRNSFSVSGLILCLNEPVIANPGHTFAIIVMRASVFILFIILG